MIHHYRILSFSSTVHNFYFIKITCTNMSAATASSKTKIRLHYLNCRGRAQAFRYMLEDIAYAHKDVDYKEDFEKVDTFLTTWPQIKSDQTISGPYRTLPVLHWNETHTFGQTLTIGLIYENRSNFLISSFFF